MAEERGVVPCGICGKWVFNDVQTVDKEGHPVHPACLNRQCDFCQNPKKLPVSLHWDVEKDENMFMCEDCMKYRKISDPPEAKTLGKRPWSKQRQADWVAIHWEAIYVIAKFIEMGALIIIAGYCIVHW